MSRTDVAQTLLSVRGLATAEDCKPSGPSGFGRGTDKSVCATSVPGLRRQARRSNQIVFEREFCRADSYARIVSGRQVLMLFLISLLLFS